MLVVLELAFFAAALYVHRQPCSPRMRGVLRYRRYPVSQDGLDLVLLARHPDLVVVVGVGRVVLLLQHPPAPAAAPLASSPFVLLDWVAAFPRQEP